MSIDHILNFGCVYTTKNKAQTSLLTHWLLCRVAWLAHFNDFFFFGGQIVQKRQYDLPHGGRKISCQKFGAQDGEEAWIEGGY